MAENFFAHQAPLSAGDTVAIVSPAGRGTDEALAWATSYLENLGLKVITGINLFAHHPRAEYLAGTDDQRRQDLVAAWTNPEVDAVICARGGYGAMRLLDGIDWELMKQHTYRANGLPKLLTGSSDITALHEAWRFHLDVPTLFCPMVTNDVFKDSDFIQQDVARWLLEPWAGRTLVGPSCQVLVGGRVSGLFTGGNLSLLAAGIGAPESLDIPEGILFLEDIDEDCYRIDNLLIQLKRFGRLEKAQGIVLGSWHNCDDDLGKIKDLLTEYVADAGVPVLWEQGFGHDPNALSIPLNIEGILDATGDQPRLEIPE